MNPDLAPLPVVADDVERATDPAAYVVQACERAKAWLADAVEHGAIERIVEFRSQAEAVRIYTMATPFDRDVRLAAAEMVRRAERGIGVAIRKGQEKGTIATRNELRAYAARIRNPRPDGILPHRKPAPTDYVPSDDLTGNGTGIYHLTDGYSDEQFEWAIAAGRAAGSLARAGVIRRLRQQASGGPAPEFGDRAPEAAFRRRELIRRYAAEGYSSRQISHMVNTTDDTVREIARELGLDIPADAIMGRTRRHDPNRIVRETATALEGLAIGVGLIDYTDLDPDEINDWVRSLTASVRAINRLVKQLKERTQ